MGPINWAGRTAQVEVTINTVWEACQAILDVFVTKVTRTSTITYDIEEWMWGIEEDDPKVETRSSDAIDHRPEWRNAHLQHAGQGSRQHRKQGRPQFPGDASGSSPSSGGRSSNWGSD